jgi:hypothetical protein
MRCAMMIGALVTTILERPLLKKNNATRSVAVAGALALSLLAVVTPAAAADPVPGQSSESVLALLRLLVAEGVLSPEKAQSLIAQVEREAAAARGEVGAQPPTSGDASAPAAANPAPAQAAAGAAPASAPAQEPAAAKPGPAQAAGSASTAPAKKPSDPSVDPSAPRAANAVEAVVAATPPRVKSSDGSWIKRIRIDGDFRIRWQDDFYDDGNSSEIPDWGAVVDSGGTTAPVSDFINATENRPRLRYRARLGFTAAVADRVSAVLRLVVGNETDPVSTNETLGDYFNRDNIVADRAFIRFALSDDLALLGGRMANPFYTTDMIWDGDVNPEGIAATFEHTFGKSTRVFGVAGVYALQEFATRDDRWLYAGQLGVETQLGQVASAKVGVAYYHYDNISGRRGEATSRPGLVSKGNSLFNVATDDEIVPGLAAKFRTAALTGAFDFKGIKPVVITVTGEVAVNLGYDGDEIRALPLLTEEPTGSLAWTAELRVGSAKVAHWGDWQAALAYRYMQSDSILDAFNDGDFNLGGTNSEGMSAELLYDVVQDTWLQATWFHPHSLTAAPYKMDSIRLALTTRF